MQQGLEISIHRELLGGAPLIKGARRKPGVTLLMHLALTMEGPWIQPQWVLQPQQKMKGLGVLSIGIIHKSYLVRI